MMTPIAWVVALAAILSPGVVHACMPPTIEFSHASTRLGPQGRAQIARAAESLQASRGAVVKLLAQSDGSTQNLRMSRRRVRLFEQPS